MSEFVYFVLGSLGYYGVTFAATSRVHSQMTREGIMLAAVFLFPAAVLLAYVCHKSGS